MTHPVQVEGPSESMPVDAGQAPLGAAAATVRSPRDGDARLRLLDFPVVEGQAQLAGLVGELGEPAFRARQVQHAVWRRHVRSPQRMTDLPLALRGRLEERLRIGLLELVHRATSRDGTVKYLWRLVDGGEIESVAIPSVGRLTSCVSTQVGCALHCKFCATGSLGLMRNLTPGEIVDQVLAMLEDGAANPGGALAPSGEAKSLEGAAPPSQGALNVVFMGMGEPGYNMRSVLAACHAFNDEHGLRMGARRLTVSTAGVVPAIRELANEPLPVRLAVSLHSADQHVRESLMDVARRHPLDELLAACREYHDATGRRVTFEYAVMPGVNDSAAAARSLASFAAKLPSNVNLIPYNPVEGFAAARASDSDVERFRKQLALHFSGEIAVRRTRGQDIEAACGMLHRARGAARHAAP